jgi:pilus assembly protein CpaF
MLFEEVVDAIFRADRGIDEVLFDGLDSFAIVKGEVKSYGRSPLKDMELSRIQDFALSQGVRWDPVQPAAGGMFKTSVAGDEMYYRWHGLLQPVARDGLLLSIRRHRLNEIGVGDFIRSGDQTRIMGMLNTCSPVLVMGPTGSGKTSFMVSMLMSFAEHERVAIVEHLPEVPRLSQRWIRLCGQPPLLSGEGGFKLETLIDELLRLRPDRIVIGELRREEVPAYRRALLAGHGAVWTTVHAASAHELPQRMAEFGAGSAREWKDLFCQLGALVVCLERGVERLQGIYRYTSDGLGQIF